jgi:hypothetical protein
MSAAVSAAMAASAAATAGTAFYMLSDGGDAAVAKRRVDGALARVLPDRRAAGGTAPASQPDQASDPALDLPQSAAAAAAEMRQRQHQVASPFPPRRDVPRDESAYGACHTCSGPRFWFYADKLGVTRLKRRIGPNSDP